MTDKVSITVFRWAGAWGPFRVKIPCGECALTLDIIQDTLANELAGIEVELEIRDWLSEWWKPLVKGGWHAPIVMVNGGVISQGAALNRGLLTQAVIECHSTRSELKGSHIYGKESCPHCLRAKGYLDDAGVDYTFHDVIRSERDLYEMLGRVKPIVGPATPITVPQIWIDGSHIGGADELGTILHRLVEPNYDRGQCSISPDR
jgi:glutaredoxin